jgi:hypothetical protein
MTPKPSDGRLLIHIKTSPHTVEKGFLKEMDTRETIPDLNPEKRKRKNQTSLHTSIRDSPYTMARKQRKIGY